MLRAKYFARRIFQRIRAAIAVRVGNPVNVARERFESGFIWLRFAGQRHGQHGAAVERVFEANDGGTPRVATRDFDGVFDRFGTAVYEDRLLGKIAWRQCIQFFGERDVVGVGRDAEAGVKETIELRTDGGDNSIRAMTDIGTPNPARKVNKAIAVHVFDDSALRPSRKHGRRVIDAAWHGLRAATHQFLRLRSGYGSAELNCGHFSTIRSAVR